MSPEEKGLMFQTLDRIATSLEGLEKIENESQEREREVYQTLDWVSNMCSQCNEIFDRVNAMEETIKKVPEFYEYWKKSSACGYMD